MSLEPVFDFVEESHFLNFAAFSVGGLGSFFPFDWEAEPSVVHEVIIKVNFLNFLDGLLLDFLLLLIFLFDGPLGPLVDFFVDELELFPILLLEFIIDFVAAVTEVG